MRWDETERKIKKRNMMIRRIFKHGKNWMAYDMEGCWNRIWYERTGQDRTGWNRIGQH